MNQIITDTFGSTYSVCIPPVAIKPPLIEQRVRVVCDRHASNPLDDEELVIHWQLGQRHHNYRGGYVRDGRHFRRWLDTIPSYRVWEAMKLAAFNVADLDDVMEGIPDLDCADEVEKFLKLMPDIVVATVQGEGTKFIALSQEVAEREGIDWDGAQALVDAIAETYNDWCEGRCYGVIVEQRVVPDGIEDCDDDGEAWEEVDACWGFIGDDFRTNGMTDHVPVELHDQLFNAQVEY